MTQNDSTETSELLQAVAAGDQNAFDELLARHRQDLLRFVSLRLDARLQARVDPSDVVQETQLMATRRMEDYLRRRPMPFTVWLRRTAYEQLLMIRRRETRSGRRSVLRELPLPENSSLALANSLLRSEASPSRAIAKRETVHKVRQAISRLGSRDREVLLMRTFEAASYEEIGFLFGISPDAAKKRHGRALLRLHQILLESGLGGSDT